MILNSPLSPKVLELHLNIEHAGYLACLRHALILEYRICCYWWEVRIALSLGLWPVFGPIIHSSKDSASTCGGCGLLGIFLNETSANITRWKNSHEIAGNVVSWSLQNQRMFSTVAPLTRINRQCLQRDSSHAGAH